MTGLEHAMKTCWTPLCPMVKSASYSILKEADDASMTRSACYSSPMTRNASHLSAMINSHPCESLTDTRRSSWYVHLRRQRAQQSRNILHSNEASQTAQQHGQHEFRSVREPPAFSPNFTSLIAWLPASATRRVRSSIQTASLGLFKPAEVPWPLLLPGSGNHLFDA